MKTAIFLGAGASASEGAPIQSKLFFEYFKSLKSNPPFATSEMERELATFFALMFDINVDVSVSQLVNINFPTFEEALGVLDLANIRNESFREFSNLNISTNSGRLKRMRLYLTLLMARAIHNNLFTSKKIHLKLVNKLRKQNKLSDIFFVSTNYDILIDNAIVKQLPNFTLDYGVDFVNYKESDDWSKPNSNSISLYKLHGSLNWLYCPTCNNLRLTPKEKGVIKLLGVENYSHKDASCKSCNTIYSPIIVPPTFYKDFTNVFLNLIWNKTEQDLLNTDHIIFCGYSFPDADMHIKYLIKRIQKNRRMNNLKISVVNNHSRKSKIAKDVEKYRYKRFLGNAINFTDLSFENFAINPELLIDNR